MKGPAQENDFAKHSKEMNGSIPSQYDNKDFGKKRKAKAHKFSVKDTKNGKTYWTPAILEKLSFTDYLIQESSEQKILDKITTLPDIIISELKKLISKGAKDFAQDWEDAAELVNTAYHVARIRRPIPDQRGAWKQYEELLKYGVQQLWNTRGNKANWRSAKVVYGESVVDPGKLLTEKMGGTRFFVKIPGEVNAEIDAKDMTEVIRELSNKVRRHGGQIEVRHRTPEGAILIVWKNDEEVDEIIVQAVS